MRRRDLLLAGGLGALCFPRRLFAAPEADERLFLFVVCDGGWDPTMVFASALDNPHAWREPDAELASVGALDFVDHPERPSVRAFFEEVGERVALVNGLDLETIAHDRGMRSLLTGGPAGADDWGAILGAGSARSLLMPHVVVSGPTYTHRFSSSVVRVGSDGQLAALLDPARLPTPLDPPAEDEVARFLEARAQGLAEASSGQSAAFYAEQARLAELARTAPAVDLGASGGSEEACLQTFLPEAQVALDLFEQGLARSAVVLDTGWCEARWDSHNDIADQTRHYELLFQGLSALMLELDARTGPAGGRLSDQTTVVVCSELGRHPALNDLGGKHHWPVTSAMLIGGVRSGVVGGFDGEMLGEPVDGARLGPGNLGATLLALADLDPAEHTDAAPLVDLL